jgi:uncharacterized protein YndB with AHSA1/START domain
VQPDGKASKTKSLLRVEVGVSINIKAKPDRIWSLLTNAREFPAWNSTAKSIEGPMLQPDAKGKRHNRLYDV